jgi:uncharacterized protein
LKPSATLLLSAVLASAFDFSALKQQGYVTDFARVIDAQSEAALERYAAAVEKASSVKMAFVTLPNLQGEPVDAVADVLHRKWQLGDQGALLLLAIRERRSGLLAGRQLNHALPEGTLAELLEHMEPSLEQNRFGDALRLGALEIGFRIELAKGTKLEAELPAPAEPGIRRAWLVLCGTGVALTALVVVFRRRAKAALEAQKCRRAISRGGFGGYDSSDSFGGFGGADAGGGASNYW